MTTGAIDHRRVLLIVSSDYGELGAALHFLSGLSLAEPALLLIPPKLLHTVQGLPGLRVQVQQGAADIHSAIDGFRPDTVLLASGYLVALDAKVSIPALFWLLRRLRRLGAVTLTTDPYLGVRPEPMRQLRTNLRQRKHRDALLGALALWPITRLLADVWHVYPAPLSRLPRLAENPRCRGFRGQATAADRPPLAAGSETPQWVFVLSALEYRLLAHGHQGRFEALLMARLHDCADAGRKALLVGPQPLVDRVRAQWPNATWLQARCDLGYADYLQQLMAAEYAFFWNMMSFSTIHRVMADLPVFYFDEGHLAHIHPAFWQAGVRLFYDGWQPPCLDLAEALDPAALRAGAAAVRPIMRQLVEGMRRSPSASELLNALPGVP